MNKKSIILCLAMTILPLLASAHDFEVNGIYYNITSSTTAEVTSSDGTKYSGSITLPATVTHNGVEYSVTSIGDEAFRYCSSLKSITLPEGVTSIGEYAFYGCSSLTAITIPKGVTSIGYEAFHWCSSLTDITIPESVTSIGNYAFYQCSSLTSITIPENSKLTSIGEWAFRYCSSLKSITLPEGVTSIDDGAFNACSSLTAIKIPEGVTGIGERAFSSCISLTAIVVAEGNKVYDSRGGCNAIIETSSNTLIQGCSTTIIPESVTSIADGAFWGCSSLTSITIPESVTSIGDHAFDGCSSLTTITIPESVTSIADGAFWGCSSLESITIPESVTSIGDEAFAWCSSLESITIPESVTSIGERAFDYCSGLTAINIPEGVTSIGNSAFDRCSNLTSVTIPENSRLTSIGTWAFSGCSSLKELTLGKGLKKIAAEAFNSCTALEKVTIYATQPPSIEGTGNAFFSDATYENATLYVPQGCIDKYQVMTGWSYFYTIEEMEGGTPNYLTLRQADNGEVGIVVEPGRTYKVRITAFEGWKIHSVTFNGEDVTAQLTEEGIYTTPALQADAVLNIAYEKTDNSTMVANTAARAIKVQGHRGTLRVTGATEGDDISVYTTNGAMVAHQQGEADENLFTVETNKVYIVKIADKVVKIGM